MVKGGGDNKDAPVLKLHVTRSHGDLTCGKDLQNFTIGIKHCDAWFVCLANHKNDGDDLACLGRDQRKIANPEARVMRTNERTNDALTAIEFQPERRIRDSFSPGERKINTTWFGDIGSADSDIKLKWRYCNQIVTRTEPALHARLSIAFPFQPSFI